MAAEELQANGHWVSIVMIFGGGRLLVVKTADSNNPSTIEVTYHEVAAVE